MSLFLEVMIFEVNTRRDELRRNQKYITYPGSECLPEFECNSQNAVMHVEDIYNRIMMWFEKT